MTNQEYINEHPEKFVDDIDKWLFTEFSIVGGCCSAQGSMEYSVARMVAEKMKQQMIDKACEWLENIPLEDIVYKYNDFDTSEDWYKFINDFRKAMED